MPGRSSTAGRRCSAPAEALDRRRTEVPAGGSGRRRRGCRPPPRCAAASRHLWILERIEDEHERWLVAPPHAPGSPERGGDAVRQTSAPWWPSKPAIAVSVPRPRRSGSQPDAWRTSVEALRRWGRPAGEGGRRQRRPLDRRGPRPASSGPSRSGRRSPSFGRGLGGMSLRAARLFGGRTGRTAAVGRRIRPLRSSSAIRRTTRFGVRRVGAPRGSGPAADGARHDAGPGRGPGRSATAGGTEPRRPTARTAGGRPPARGPGSRSREEIHGVERAARWSAASACAPRRPGAPRTASGSPPGSPPDGATTPVPGAPAGSGRGRPPDHVGEPPAALTRRAAPRTGRPSRRASPPSAAPRLLPFGPAGRAPSRSACPAAPGVVINRSISHDRPQALRQRVRRACLDGHAERSEPSRKRSDAAKSRAARPIGLGRGPRGSSSSSASQGSRDPQVMGARRPPSAVRAALIRRLTSRTRSGDGEAAGR